MKELIYTDMIVDIEVDFDAKVENVVDCDAFYLILIKKRSNNLNI